MEVKVVGPDGSVRMIAEAEVERAGFDALRAKIHPRPMPQVISQAAILSLGLEALGLCAWDDGCTDRAGATPVKPKAATPGRNDPCHCGSGKKFKKCHMRS